MAWLLLLGVAVAAEVTATLAMKASDGLTRLGPTLVVLVGYGAAFAVMAQTVRSLGVGVVYAIWSGLGTVGVAAGAWWWFGERLGARGIVGIALVVVGVVLVESSAVAPG